MHDPSHILTRLIIAGEAALCLRRSTSQEEMLALCEAVRAEADKPCDGVRVIGDVTKLYTKALRLADEALHRHDRKRAAVMGRVVAVLLPEIRDALSDAIEQRNRPSP